MFEGLPIAVTLGVLIFFGFLFLCIVVAYFLD